jgi:hypothetical protein
MNLKVCVTPTCLFLFLRACLVQGHVTIAFQQSKPFPCLLHHHPVTLTERTQYHYVTTGTVMSDSHNANCPTVFLRLIWFIFFWYLSVSFRSVTVSEYLPQTYLSILFNISEYLTQTYLNIFFNISEYLPRLSDCIFLAHRSIFFRYIGVVYVFCSVHFNIIIWCKPTICTFVKLRVILIVTMFSCTSLYFYSKSNKIHQFLKFILFLSNTLHVSDGRSVHHQEFKTMHTATGICQTDNAACLLEGTRSLQLTA